ncbi:peroxidasin homolog [Caerostris darwini]|uniref:Peroxidasin homolog n=1 Tax=Caerostris darwini TaxID=1538125 RepID=A0AAV4VGC2_9ARAC|nr:peroxidasin homolog [Caerostris darwini]
MESLEEYRSLLHSRNKASFWKKIMYSCPSQPSEKKIIAAVFLCLCIGVTFIALKKSFLDKYSTYDTFNRDEEELWNCNSTEDRKLFLELWEKGNILISKHRDYTYKEKDKEIEPMVECELILEYVKRSVKKCVSIDVLPDKCKKIIWEPVYCSSRSRYRNINGSCNNLYHHDWGMTDAAFLRWLTPDYTDDVSMPRQSVYGGSLPRVRELSNKLFSLKTLPNSNVTMMFTHFGLFIDHDMVKAGQTDGNMTSCCEDDPKVRHPLCLKVEISKSDPLYGPLNITCKGLLRSPPVVGKCPGRREQHNHMTSFIDASDLYGPTEVESARLRRHKRGHLRSSKVNATPLLPQLENSGSACYTQYANNSCFASGDSRVNLIMPLMALHTLWLREHNRLADVLHSINPMWDDEQLFQESRRILIAELQLITYREFLPLIFGDELMKQYGLHIDETRRYDGYDEMINPGIHNSFAAAAFRFGHALVRNSVELRDENYKLIDNILLRETYLNPNVLYDRGFDYVIRGMVGQKAQQVHRYTTEEIRGRLMQRFNQNHGYDLTAISVLRGRDHGIPSYLKWREFCKLPVAKSWKELKQYMKKDYVKTFSDIYDSVEDIDLIPGGLGEKHVEGALLGPTYICLLGKQFSALRKGDRFWFENQNQPGSFNRGFQMLISSSNCILYAQKYPDTTSCTIGVA